jgi:hypothetical protein
MLRSFAIGHDERLDVRDALGAELFDFRTRTTNGECPILERQPLHPIGLGALFVTSGTWSAPVRINGS